MSRFSLLWLLLVSSIASAGESKVAGRRSPDGKEEIAIDLPAAQHLRNKAGSDGLGLCVFTSSTMSGEWSNEDVLRSLQQKMTREKGGGWPEKVDQVMGRFAPGVQYLQYTGRDPNIIQSAIHSGRMPCVTYGYSPRYAGPRNPSGRIAHMVDCVHYSAAWVAVLDNNFPGDDQYEWMAPDEFKRRWMLGNPGGGWVVLPLRCGPSPIPVNGTHPVIGQCRDGVCPLVPSPSFEWRTIADDDSQIALYRSGTQIGAYSFRTGSYRPFDATRQTWGQTCSSPIEPPTVGDSPIQNFGVRQDKLPRRDGFSINGQPITQTEAERALKCGGGFTDDSAKWRLTIIGPTKAKRDQVLSDLQTNSLLAPWQERLCVQSYSPDAWAVTGVNLPHNGDPTIVVQSAPDANGKAAVLHCQYDYDDGPEGLVKALRAADPNFNPKNVPDLRKGDPAPAPVTPTPAPSIHWLTVALSAAIPLGLMLLGKSYPVLASVLTAIWNAVKPQPAPTLPPALQPLLDRLSKLEQQQVQK